MTKVYLIEKSRKRAGKKPASYYILRWSNSQGKSQEDSLGKTKKSGGDLTKAGAERLRQEKEQEIAGGRAPLDRMRKLTLAAFFKEHEEWTRAKVSAGTMVEYKHAADHALKALGETVLLERIGVSEITRVENHLREGSKSNATINKTLRSLRAMLARAVKHQLIMRNPLSGWELPESQARAVRVFERDEIALMVEVAPSVWWKSLIRVLADSGLRRMELLHLRWADIDFGAGTLQVQPRRGGSFKVADETYPIIEWKVKARASSRTVPLPASTMTMLRRMKLKSDGSAYVFLPLRRLRQVERQLDGRGALPAKFDLVPNLLRDFKVIQDDARELIAERRKVEVSKVKWVPGCLHDLRVSWCTQAAKELPMHVLKEYAGHQDIATTAKHYLKTTSDDAAALRRALSA